MAALNAALALSEADNAAVRVSEYLELNVAGPLDILLHVEVAVAEGGSGFRGSGFEQSRQLFLITNDAHAPAAATCRRFNNDRKADLTRPLDRKSTRLNSSH